ncbi:putative neutral sphingomyelinase isoform X3 [Acanthaster planci]|uniref:sphingomyelin phosphodiesterase n=1 Tax=Acanthaster planci TaxID=133434 RepID=A0A8B7ZIH2_ACAPL|nr:putative neutral sphingomyelinase isoform X3 [Acanthaster planci]
MLYVDSASAVQIALCFVEIEVGSSVWGNHRFFSGWKDIRIAKMARPWKEEKRQIRVVTLNCWGLMYVSSHREKRIGCLGDELAKGCYDVVTLQENTAMYAPSNVFSADEHFTHRLLQGYELSKFVRFTGTNSDLNVVTGDFNTEDNSLGLKVARVNADLQDAWLDRPNQCKDEPCCTVEAPDNCYTSTKTRFYPQHPGMRIDYILYNAKPRSCCVTCRDCRLTFKKIPGTDINYSDHDGVEALFELEKGRDDQVLEPSDEEGRLGVLLEMLPYLSDSIQKITRQRFCYLLVSLLFFLLLASLWLSGAFHWQTSVYARCGALVALLALVVLGLAALCIGVSVKTTELNQLIGRKREITLNVRRLESQLKNK